MFNPGMFSPGPWLVLDAFNTVPLVLYGLLWIAALTMAPRQDRGHRFDYALILMGTTLAYCANHLALFWLGWTLSALPLLRERAIRNASRIALLGGCAVLAGGLILLANRAYEPWAFALIMLAAIQRKGLFPLQSWIVDCFENADLLKTALVFNGHLGAMVVVRIAMPLLPELSRPALTSLAEFSLVATVVAAIAAIAERHPRRQFGWIAVSEAAAILAGIAGSNSPAVSGALLHWMVVSLATTALVAVLRSIEVRETPQWETLRDGGLAGRYPRLAVFFAIAAFALVGLPGTLGFISGDLLVHGSLSAHPLTGIAIPLSTALNAITLFRLFSRIFLGSRRQASNFVPDALLRERLPLTLILCALVTLGLFPRIALDLRAAAVEAIQGIEPGSQRPVSRAAAGPRGS